jgi:hypothetical protein
MVDPQLLVTAANPRDGSAKMPLPTIRRIASRHASAFAISCNELRLVY